MSLLTQLLSVLTDSERSTIQKLPLRGKQEAILSAAISATSLPDAAVERKAAALGMSESHIHATLSLLLQRCYDALVPERGFELLVLLQTRGLEIHFKREFQAQERSIRQQTTDKGELQEFYLRTLHLLIGVTSVTFNVKLFTAIMILCRRSSTMSETETVLHFQVCRLLRDVVNYAVNPVQKKPADYKEQIYKRLIEIEQSLEGQQAPLARYHLSYSFLIYYAVLSSDVEKFRAYLRLLEHDLQLLPPTIREDERPKIELRKGSLAFFEGDLERAYKIYFDELTEYGITPYQRFRFHLDIFIRLALALKKTELAGQLLKEGFAPLLTIKRTPLATSEAIYRTELALNEKRLKVARKALDDGYRSNIGSNYVLAMDIQLRLLDWIIAADDDFDPKHLEARLAKDIKHFYRKGLRRDEESQLAIFSNLKEFLRDKNKPKLRTTLGKHLQTHPVLITLLLAVLN